MSSEVSRSERARQDRLAEDQKVKPKPKEQESDFDKVLKQSQIATQKPPILTQKETKTLTEEAVRDARRHEDRSKDDERREDKDKDKKGDQGTREKKSSSGILDNRVVGKGHSQDGERGGAGGGGQGRGGFSFSQGRRNLNMEKQKGVSKLAEALVQRKFADKLQSTMAKGLKDPSLTQSVLNQLVQYVKIGINEKMEKEIRIELHERIFRGLKLSVASKDGKVQVHFMSADSQTRSVFERNSGAIKDALEKKGIVVEDIRVS